MSNFYYITEGLFSIVLNNIIVSGCSLEGWREGTRSWEEKESVEEGRDERGET